MGYLFFQILIWLLLAFGLGGIVGWLLRGFTHALQSSDQVSSESFSSTNDHIMVTLLKKELHSYKTKYNELKSQTKANQVDPGRRANSRRQIDAAWRPDALEPPENGADDLKVIRGIGPKIEQTLNDLGIYRLQQIAHFSPENTLWIDHHLRFPRRVGREKWVQQAQALVGKAATG
jgi:predicted flap endonuclease-1-like 5' DNA nuclease